MRTEEEYLEQNGIYKQQRQEIHNPVAEANCLSKIAYSKDMAISKAKAWGLNYYKCQICGAYHLTRQQTYESTMEVTND